MKDKFFYLVFFCLILALSRIIPHPPNFTPILAAAITAPLIVKDRVFGIVILILAMFVSDAVIGFHSYQVVVYLTLLSITLVSPIQKNYLKLGIFAIGGSIWFFLLTNFSVWLVWDYYPKTIEGLITCYTLAIPFFKNTLISTCLFTSLLTISLKYLNTVNEKTNYWIFKFIKKTL